jgi:antitoxin (DNA-binding transcriptional repressor) of toxin-antitoxin stability system
MTSVDISEAKNIFLELAIKAMKGEEVILTQNEQPVLQLVLISPKMTAVERGKRQPGTAKDLISYMADDFDEPLEDFKEYM